MHAIIIGGGVVGYTIAKKLSSEGQEVVLIEQDEKKVRDLQESLDVRIIHGSGSSPSVLTEAGIEKAEMVIAVTTSDEVNMVACLIAGTQSKVPKKIARIRNPEYINYTKIFEKEYLDLDLNIKPEKVAAERILKIIEVPGAIDVVDFAEGRFKLVGCRLTIDSPCIGKSPKDIDELRSEKNTVIVAVYRGSETIIPDGTTILKLDDIVFAMTIPDHAAKYIQIISGKGEKSGKKVMIVGGGEVGFYLAGELEKNNYKVKIIERNAKRCEFLAEHLDKSIVLQGDGTDQDLLLEENIKDVDTFVASTNDEEANILTSLLSKRLNNERCITLIDKPEYLSMVSTIGIDVVVSPRLSSVGGILQFVRKGKVLSVTTLMEERVEGIETVAMETSDIIGKPLSKIKFPKGIIVGAVVKDETAIIPCGETIINPGDKVVVFTTKNMVSKLEKILAVKPNFF